MNEIILELEQISPKEFFGPQNKNIELLKRYFPKLKIVARGNKITAFGDEDLLEEFDKRMEMLFSHFTAYNNLDENMIERILTSDSKDDYTTSNESGKVLLHGVNGRLIKAQTTNQRKLVDAVRQNDMVFAIGPAGRDMIPAEKLDNYIEKGTIQIAPLAFMRGRTLDHAFVILDEGQNTTHAQMKMFLTRMGKNAKFLLTGDPGQIDLPRRVISGLKEALLILKDIKGVGMVFLDDKDVIRHKLVKKVIEAYKNIENRE